MTERLNCCNKANHSCTRISDALLEAVTAAEYAKLAMLSTALSGTILASTATHCMSVLQYSGSMQSQCTAFGSDEWCKSSSITIDFWGFDCCTQRPKQGSAKVKLNVKKTVLWADSERCGAPISSPTPCTARHVMLALPRCRRLKWPRHYETSDCSCFSDIATVSLSWFKFDRQSETCAKLLTRGKRRAAA